MEGWRKLFWRGTMQFGQIVKRHCNGNRIGDAVLVRAGVNIGNE